MQQHWECITVVLSKDPLAYNATNRFFYPGQVDAKTGKIFLSKTLVKNLFPNDLYVGGTVLV